MKRILIITNSSVEDVKLLEHISRNHLSITFSDEEMLPSFGENSELLNSFTDVLIKDEVLSRVQTVLSTHFFTAPTLLIYSQEKLVSIMQTMEELTCPDGEWDNPYDQQQTAGNTTHKFEIKNSIMKIDSSFYHLSKRRQMILELLVKEKHRFVSNQEIYEKVWNCPYSCEKQPAISNLMTKIRKDLMELTGDTIPMIINRKGIGYKIADNYAYVTE
jgi:DNA-binding response OmpR family regulator